MNFAEGKFYHIYNRGNNKQAIFFNIENYHFFLRKVRKELIPYCDIIAYCLMPNHFHFLVYIKEGGLPYSGSLNKGIAVLLRSYTRAIQKEQGITGSLFQQKTKAKEIDNDTAHVTINQIAVCMHYIHQNPLRARLTDSLDEWKFSSYPDYAGLRQGTLCNKETGFIFSGIDKDRFVKESYEVIPEQYARDFYKLIDDFGSKDYSSFNLNSSDDLSHRMSD